MNLQLVSEYLGSGEPITEGLIREIHKRLVIDVRGGDGAPGLYRTVQNYVANSHTRAIIYTPPPPTDVPPLMQELVAWLRAPAACTRKSHVNPFSHTNSRQACATACATLAT